jgi:hypothetical protein
MHTITLPKEVQAHKIVNIIYIIHFVVLKVSKQIVALE